ncbi:MAG: spore maturation protein A, partial [Oscillospiraceae bacterium]|nr:spore maturation protein A [Oscillospiraceae bacterium]
ISRLMMPILVRLFKGLDKNSRAMQAIAMNITANLFGLGNAATPLGIEAMKRLEQEEKTGEVASKNMILFAVLNTSSVELIPATVATLRLAYGSREPMVILPCVLLVSLMSVAVCITLVNIFNRSEK